jgi:hypothetical protein
MGIIVTSQSVDLSLIHPRFKKRLENFFMDGRVNGHIKITSGCRSYAEQKRLYDKYRRGRGNLAANPDWKRPDGFFRGSFHQEQPDGYSYAVDLGLIKWGGPTKADVTRVANAYGLRPTVQGEWWHFQPRDGHAWFTCTAYKDTWAEPPMDWAALVAWHAELGRRISLSPLRRGSRGVEVEMVQRRLNAIDFWCGTADGIFGRKTKAAATRLQRVTLLNTTGVVDSMTWDTMWNPLVPDGL